MTVTMTVFEMSNPKYDSMLCMIPDSDKFVNEKCDDGRKVYVKLDTLSAEEHQLLDSLCSEPKQEPPTLPKPKPKRAKQENKSSLLENICENISDEFIADYHHWQKIVWSMKAAGLSEDFARTISKSSDPDKVKYTDEGFEKCWSEYDASKQSNKGKLTTGTLHYYSKMSNPRAYIKLIADSFDREAVPETDVQIINKFRELYQGDVIYQNDAVYFYENEEWLRDDTKESSHIYTRISEIMTMFFEELLKPEQVKLDKMLADTNVDAGDLERQKILVSNLNSRRRKCGTHTNLVNLTKSLKNFSVSMEEVQFDTGEDQINNIHFKNGVYQFDTDEFRSRNNKDYVTQFLPYNYEPDDCDEEDVEEIMNELKKFVPDKDNLRMLLSYIADALTGRCSSETFLIIVGYLAGNGKSTILKILSQVFPTYIKKIDREGFMKAESQKHKHLACLINNPVRLVYVEELGDGKIDTELIKNITGGDSIQIKKMYGTTMEVQPRFKIIGTSQCNPNLTIDEGIRRRMKLLEFNSTFRPEYEEDDYENHKYKADSSIFKKFNSKRGRAALFKILMQKDHKEFYQPKANIQETMETMTTMDPFRDYLDDLEHLEVTTSDNDLVHKDDIIDEFKKYFDVYKDDNLTSKQTKELNESLRKVGVKYLKGKRKDGKRGFYQGVKILS